MLRALADGVFGEQHGAAPARVLALPGWMRSRADFGPVLAGYDALALDLPGFGGASPEPSRPMGAAGYAAAVAPALDACAAVVVLLGHSFGPPAGAQRAVSRLGGRATLTIVAGAGHMTPLSAAPALRAALERHAT